MIQGILGKKLGMTQVFGVDGRRISVTVIEAGPCVVTQKKSVASDGYNAFQLGFGAQKTQRLNRPMMGHLKKVGQGAFSVLREVPAEDVDTLELGAEVKCDIFAAGDIIDVTGISKGKGFQGVIKRWGFSGGRSTHGSMFHRGPGAIGGSAWPSKVFKGKKMAGQMGNARVTTQNLMVVDVRPDENIILIKGAIPGPKNSVVTIRRGIKAAKQTS